VPKRFWIAAILAVTCLAGQTPSAFEVASVRITPPDKIGYTALPKYGTNRFISTNITLDLMIQLAYGVTWNQISGMEKLGKYHYDITAKAEDGVVITGETLGPRLRQLLEQRFKLATHRETKEFPGYALVVAKAGPKLQPSKQDSTAYGMVYPGGLRAPHATMEVLAIDLASPLGRPVIDQTGVKGQYDIQLDYARDGDANSSLPSIFTALEEQLGLKLEPRKVPVELLVIDRIETVPSEN
jgi:uncharacterized protein (TIGR03435 family)